VRASSEPTYALQMLRPFLKLLRQQPQIPSAALDELEAVAAERRIPIAQAQELLRGAVALTGDQDLGLRAARATEVGAFEVLEYAAASAPTWRAALETIFRYSHLMNEAADYRLEVVGSKAHVVLHSTVPLTRAGLDFQSAAFHVAVARWQDPASPELEVWFAHEAPADLGEYRATFGTSQLIFGAPWNGFVFDAARLDTKVPSDDPSLHRVLRQHADRLLAELAPGDSLVERVRGHILSTLRGGPASAEDTAARLRMTRRTLTRRLSQEGTSFSALLEDVRRHTAVHYLQTTEHSVEDIAFLLGFSESSPFVRAFKRWTGMAPMAYRRAHARA
jgi:AraC-like DNA-binding protein